MKIKLLGIPRLDFVGDNGDRVLGSKLHYVEEDYSSDDLLGQRVDTCLLLDGSPYAGYPLEIGNEYIVSFRKKSNRVDILMDAPAGK